MINLNLYINLVLYFLFMMDGWHIYICNIRYVSINWNLYLMCYFVGRSAYPDSNSMLSQPLQKGRGDVITATSAQHRFVRRPNVGDVGSTSGQRWANIGPTLGQPSANLGVTLAQTLSDVGPTFFCQQFTNILGDFLPTFGWPFANLWFLIFLCMFLKLNSIFMSLRCPENIIFQGMLWSMTFPWHL